MQLLADRFVVDEEQPAIDLATGDRVLLTITSAGGPSDQRRWALRCDVLQKLHHPSIARLIDYGPIGESRRFEAWRCGGEWRGPDARSEAVRGGASAVLRACGLSAGSCSVRNWSGGPVVVPDGESGYSCERGDGDARDLSLQIRAISAIERRAVAAIGELFERGSGTRPHVTSLWGPEGAGKGTAIDDLARMARLHGFVPVAARVLSEWGDRLRGRSLFVIDDDKLRLGWRVLLGAALASPRPHVLLFVGAEEVPSVEGIGLEPLPADALAGAVCPAATNSARVRIREMAVRACGWPGRFARLLWGERMASRSAGLKACSGRASPLRRDSGRAARLRQGYGASAEALARRRKALHYDITPGKARGPRDNGLRVAEQSAAYGVDESLPLDVPLHARPWPASDLAALAGRLEVGVQLIAEGRHAPGERVLRQTIGALSRRGDWVRAGEGSVALAGMLLRRGRVRDAQTTLESAADWWRRGGDESRLIDVALLGGRALTDLARTDEAESTLSAALAAARSRGDPVRSAAALTALARVLFWQARYEEAEHAFLSADEYQSSGAAAAEIVVPVRSVGTATAVGTRNLDLAVSRATESMRHAQQRADPRSVADAAYAAAFAHLSVGDIGAVERDVATAVTAARAAHEPLVAARGRLLLVEALRRSGRRAAAATLLNRIGRVGSTMLPPIVGARCNLFRDLLSSPDPPHAIVARHVASTGLGALALYVPFPPAMKRGGVLDPMIDDIVEILDLCQTSLDETALLSEVCRRIRARVHGVAAAFAVVEGGGCTVITSDGGRVDLEIARRVLTAGIAIAPHRCDDRVESAVPVRYGGDVAGVLVVRWTIGALHDLSRAVSLLTAAAAAAAPILAGALAKRKRPVGPGVAGLIGVSAGMADVRRAVERVAGAPFAVLIEGESGSGKEVVARALHRCGPRRDRAFCTLNCAALPDDLVEAELFGHARGAFTGAVAERPGVFEEAHGGTLLLDEIGELAPRAQAKVLRVIQEGELRRIGENVVRRVDVHVVSATNRDLRQEVAAGRFRLDLLYRLDVIRITVPPLRERREDIAVLAEHFWREAAARVGSRASLGTATLAALARYDWPGNVRELQNVLASLAVRSPRRGVVPPSALGPQFGAQRYTDAARLEEARRTFEERFVRAALARNGGQRLRTAEELGVTRQGLTRLMSRLGISDEGTRHEGETNGT
jgi:DNA-binding NtrC family response regulator/tetratricopeptide (TPR) repeat protein